MHDFHGLDVVVTGGTGALGEAVCALLVERGARSVHVPVREERAPARFSLAAEPRVVVRFGVELTDEVAVERFYAEVPALWASIHVAGGYAGGGIVETSPEKARMLLACNAMTAWLCAREAVRRMRARSASVLGGRIVNVSARPALVPTAGLSAYAMSKAAVAALTRSLAEELRDEEIWVNAVVPSIIDTPANRAAMPEADVSRWPSVRDVAETIVFLASPLNRATRGALVPVDGRS